MTARFSHLLVGPSTPVAHVCAAGRRLLAVVVQILVAVRVYRGATHGAGASRRCTARVQASLVVAATRAARHREPSWCDPAECETWHESDGTVVVFHRRVLLDEPGPRAGNVRVQLVAAVTTPAFGPQQRDEPRLCLEGADDGLIGEQLTRFVDAVARAGQAAADDAGECAGRRGMRRHGRVRGRRSTAGASPRHGPGPSRRRS